MIRDELEAWLILVHAADLGPRRARALLDYSPDPRRGLEAGADLWRQLGFSARTCADLATPDRAAIERDLAWGQGPRRHILSWRDPRYPALLRQIPDPPLLLYVQGEVEALERPQVAMVGSRNPTPAGQRLAHEFAAALACAGLTVTSGLAAGIDGASHAGALSAGGWTVAVTGTGPDRVYPARHRDLAVSICRAGALVSEFPCATPPRRGNFPRRNRIISGLSLGTLVVEAAAQSGSLITARLALEQNREVFAVPGSVANPLARGCHQLIRDGAGLVESVEDLLAGLGGLAQWAALEQLGPAAAPPGDGPGLGDSESRLLLCIGAGPASVDRLAADCGLPVARVSALLVNLELLGHVRSGACGRYYRIDS